jgi:hypothetical protein
VPNDCENHLELTHVDKSKLEEALAAFKRGELLSYFMPEPADDTSNDWRGDNWGTKWDAYGVESDDETEIEGNSLFLNFFTAWAPPLGAYDAAVARHGFELVAYYNEFGFQVCGEYRPNEMNLCIEYQKGTAIPDDIEALYNITEFLAECEEDE